MSATIRQVVDAALEVVGEVSGAGVQTYSDDRMFGDCIRAFDLLFKKHYWEQYCQWFQLTLDGTQGVVNSDAFEYVRDFEDFQNVYRDGNPNPLPILNASRNPYTSDIVNGTTVRFWTSLHVTHTHYAKRKLQFYPKASTDIVNIRARIYPVNEWGWDDVIYLDKNLLVYATAFFTLSSDDLNPNAADTQRQLMEITFDDVMDALGRHPIVVSGNVGVPTEWT